MSEEEGLINSKLQYTLQVSSNTEKDSENQQGNTSMAIGILVQMASLMLRLTVYWQKCQLHNNNIAMTLQWALGYKLLLVQYRVGNNRVIMEDLHDRLTHHFLNDMVEGLSHCQFNTQEFLV